MRLAHCSDLHLLSLEGARILDFANKRWIGGLNLLTNRGRQYHTDAFEDMVADFPGAGVEHVLCTGDLTNVALEQEFKFARARFDKMTVPATVLPGNHDTYVADGAKYFAEVFSDLNTCDEGFGAPWPVVRVRGPVAIIGIATAITTPWFTAYGRIGEEQLARLEAALTDPRLADKIRVVGIHHPPAGARAKSRIRGLHDREAFAAVIARAGAEIVLHGHDHEDLRDSLPGPGGTVVPVLGVQSGTYEGHKPELTARYRVLDIEPGPDGGRVGASIVHHMRVWHRSSRAFVRDEQTPEKREDVGVETCRESVAN